MKIIRTFPLVLVCLAMAHAHCPEGWTSWGTKYYRLFNNPSSTWSEAEAYCERYNPGGPDGSSHLVTIASIEEHNFIFNLWKTTRKSDKVWIGYNDRVTEGQFVGTDGRPATFTFWDKGEPNDRNGEDCVEMWKSSKGGDVGAWNDQSCNDRNPFICEMRA